MKIYEIVPPNFDASTDDTDDLIKWIACPEGKAEQVCKILGWEDCKVHDITEIGLIENKKSYYVIDSAVDAFFPDSFFK